MGIRDTIVATKENFLVTSLNTIINNPLLRKTLLPKLDAKIHKSLVENTSRPKPIQEKKYQFFSALLAGTMRNLEKGWVSKDVSKKLIKVFVGNALMGIKETQDIRDKCEKEHGVKPVSFIVFSPTQKCNLSCTGCYASSAAEATLKTMPWKTVHRIAKDCHDVLGHKFMTISGGEPFLYNDSGKTLFDIWEEFNDMFFMVYTNGTLITKEVAARLAKLGNVTPAISVEGWEAVTDERRGPGTYKKILQAMENLREAGVPFGISVTGTTKNIDDLLDDKFYEHFFNEQGAIYMWQFQLMPVGRALDSDLIINPKQRVALYHQWKHIIKDKKHCVADFWCSGELSDGCLAYGRPGGYMYIDWDGKIMPCVFVPYYVYKAQDLFDEGKTLAESLKTNFFERGRKWQKDYALDHPETPGNWLMPCSIRDHHANWRKNIYTEEAKPEDEAAQVALDSKQYHEDLEKFDKELEELTKPIWDKELKGET